MFFPSAIFFNLFLFIIFIHSGFYILHTLYNLFSACPPLLVNRIRLQINFLRFFFMVYLHFLIYLYYYYYIFIIFIIVFIRISPRSHFVFISFLVLFAVLFNRQTLVSFSCKEED